MVSIETNQRNIRINFFHDQKEIGFTTFGNVKLMYLLLSDVSKDKFCLQNKPPLAWKKFPYKSAFFLTYFILSFGFKDSGVNFFDQSVPLSQGLSQLL